MCRSIKVLFNFDPPATNEDIKAASLQFVRKLSGFTKPSQANEEVFNKAVEEVHKAAQKLLVNLVTNAEPRDRVEFELKKKLRFQERLAKSDPRY